MPELDNDFCTEFFPNIQLKPALAQPEAVSSHPTWSPSWIASGTVIQTLPAARSPPFPGDVTRLDGSLPHTPRPSTPLTSLSTLSATLSPLFLFWEPSRIYVLVGPTHVGQTASTGQKPSWSFLRAPGDLLAMLTPLIPDKYGTQAEQ